MKQPVTENETRDCADFQQPNPPLGWLIMAFTAGSGVAAMFWFCVWVTAWILQ
jgi:hypothetical protein